MRSASLLVRRRCRNSERSKRRSFSRTLSRSGPQSKAWSWTLTQPGNEHVRSVNAIVGETNDADLNDIRGGHVTRSHVIEAIRSASAGPVKEGAVGAGTGTSAFGWKGGIGSLRVGIRRLTFDVRLDGSAYGFGQLAGGR